MRSYSQTKPEVFAVSPSDLRHHLRIDAREDDQLLLRLELSALAHIEDKIGAVLMSRTVTMSIDSFPIYENIQLPVQPATAVSSIVYRDENGNDQTLDDSQYHLNITGNFGEIAPAPGAQWPAVFEDKKSITIKYRAGYESPNEVPEPIRLAVMLLVGHWYEHREASSSSNLRDIPIGVDSLIAPYRILKT